MIGGGGFLHLTRPSCSVTLAGSLQHAAESIIINVVHV